MTISVELGKAQVNQVADALREEVKKLPSTFTPEEEAAVRNALDALRDRGTSCVRRRCRTILKFSACAVCMGATALVILALTKSNLLEKIGA